MAHLVPFRVRADSIVVAKAAIEAFIAKIERNEPDTLIYRSYRDEKDPLSFVHYMLFKDAAAQAKHRGSDYCAEFVKTLYPCCEQKPRPVNLALFREAAVGAEI